MFMGFFFLGGGSKSILKQVQMLPFVSTVLHLYFGNNQILYMMQEWPGLLCNYTETTYVL